MGNIENMEKIHIAVCDDDELNHREGGEGIWTFSAYLRS